MEVNSEAPERFKKIDDRLSTYRPGSSILRPKWSEAADMVPVIPGFAQLEADRLQNTFQLGGSLPDGSINALSFQRRNFRALPTELRNQFVMLIGMANKALSEGNDDLFKRDTVEAQRVYAVYQHALRAMHNERFCDENGFAGGDVNPVFQIGHPALHMRSEEWQGSSDDARREVENFDRSQLGILKVHTSRNERSSVLGACQVVDQKDLAEKLPPRIVSIVFPFQDIDKSTVMFNPKMEISEIMLPAPLTDGWYGKFDGRIYNWVPASIKVEGMIWDREKQSLVNGSVVFDSANKTIIIQKDGYQSEEIGLKNDADMSTMRLVMDLLDGVTPLDRFEECPVGFDSGVKDRSTVSAPGVFDDLAHYYGAAAKAISARQLAAQNGRHMVENGILTNMRILEGGGLSQESATVAAIIGRHMLEGVGLVGYEVVDAPGHVVDFCFGMGPIRKPVPFELTGLSKKKERVSVAKLRLA